MRKDKSAKPDGRYIIYYSFDEDEFLCEHEDGDSEIATQGACCRCFGKPFSRNGFAFVSGKGFPETTTQSASSTPSSLSPPSSPSPHSTLSPHSPPSKEQS